MGEHVRAMLDLKARGSVVFDYGNNIRAEAQKAGVANAFDFPGFVPAYIRPALLRGQGTVPLGLPLGRPRRPRGHRRRRPRDLPAGRALARWITLARERVKPQGLPARICWLGYGERAKMGLVFNELVRSGRVKAPIVIGRDHLDAGSVASPNRETEGMRDGSDAVADWPILNALLNAVVGRHLGLRPPRRRRRHGLLDPRRHGGGRRRHARGRAPPRARAHHRPRHRRHAPRRRRLRARDRRGPRARRPA